MNIIFGVLLMLFLGFFAISACILSGREPDYFLDNRIERIADKDIAICVKSVEEFNELLDFLTDNGVGPSFINYDGGKLRLRYKQNICIRIKREKDENNNTLSFKFVIDSSSFCRNVFKIISFKEFIDN